MGTPEQLSSSKTQQVIPGERRQARSARALTPENQSIVTWRESRATAGPAPPPRLRYRGSQSEGLSAGESGDSPRRREAGAREPEGGRWQKGEGEPGEGGEGWGAPREEGSCGQPSPMWLFFFSGSCSQQLSRQSVHAERAPGGAGVGTAGEIGRAGWLRG